MNTPAKPSSSKVLWIILAASLSLNAALGWLLVRAKIGTTRAAFLGHQLDNAHSLFLDNSNASFDEGVRQLGWITSYKEESDDLIRDARLRAAMRGSYERTARQLCIRLNAMTNEPFGTDVSKWLEKYYPH
jgi:hypothetical protein